MVSSKVCPCVSSLGTGRGCTRCLCSYMQPQAGACAAFSQGWLLFFISFPVHLTYSLSLCLNLSLVLLLSLNHPRLVFLSASSSHILHQALPLPPPHPPFPRLSPSPLHTVFLPPAAVRAHECGQEAWGCRGFFPGAGGCSGTGPLSAPTLSPSLPRLPGSGDVPSSQKQPGDAECLQPPCWHGCCCAAELVAN